VIHLARSGPLTGEPIVFLHGALVGGWMWTQQAEDLAEYRCLLPNLPGFDHSGTKPWISLASTADEVADLIRAEVPDGQAAVVGLSLGGLVGLHLAVRHPPVVSSPLVSAVPASTPFYLDERSGQWRLAAPGHGRWAAHLLPRAIARRRSMQAHPAMQSRRPQAAAESAGAQLPLLR
jgi:pimeloyl-ACP methyl ester carboxylesterase